jgi:eukaryotic translation initiation factor 2C
MARNFEIINRLQTDVEPELFARPGVYDGRKNFFMAFQLPFDTGSCEVGPPCLISPSPLNRFPFQFAVPMGPPPSPGETARGARGPVEYRVRLTEAASINPEYGLYSPFPDQLILDCLLEFFKVSYVASRATITPY